MEKPVKRPPPLDLEDFDPYHKWLGIPKDKRPPTLYQLLGISPSEEDREAIEAAADRQQTFVKQFRGTAFDSHASSILFQIEDARVTLLDPDARLKYDRTLNIAHKRQRDNARVPAPIVVGQRSIGESSGLAGQFAGIMGVIIGGFVIMAGIAFAIQHFRAPQEEKVVQVPQVVQQAVGQKPEPAREKKPVVGNVVEPVKEEKPKAPPAIVEEGVSFTAVSLSIDSQGICNLAVDSRDSKVAHVALPPPDGEPIKIPAFGEAVIHQEMDGRLNVIYDFSKMTLPQFKAPGFAGPKQLADEGISLDGDEGALVLKPLLHPGEKRNRVFLPLGTVRLPIICKFWLSGMNHGQFAVQLAGESPSLLFVSLFGKDVSDEVAGTVKVIQRVGKPPSPMNTELKVVQAGGERKAYEFRISPKPANQAMFLSIYQFGDSPVAISRMEITAEFVPSFGLRLTQKGKRVVVEKSFDAAAEVLKTDDVVLKVNGTSVKDVSEAMKLLDNNGFTKDAALEVERYGKKRTVSLKPQ